MNTNPHDTPDRLVPLINKFFNDSPGARGLYLDPCSSLTSGIAAKVKYMLPDNDGRTALWSCPTIYLNPPWGYDWNDNGEELGRWLWRAVVAKQNGSEILAYLPSAQHATWWKLFVAEHADGVITLPRKISSFVDKCGDQTFIRTALAYYGDRWLTFTEIFNYGTLEAI